MATVMSILSYTVSFELNAVNATYIHKFIFINFFKAVNNYK